jgi:Uma2 family endonuclease
MAFTLEEREVRLFTADEVMEMVRVGLLSDDRQFELLHGVLTRVSPQKPRHAEVVSLLMAWLFRNLPEERYRIRGGAPVIVPDHTSLPEPDLAVVEARSYAERHPSSALFAIEVSVSSLRIDLNVKAPLYAAAGIPEYWVIDVDHARVEVFTDPGDDGYRSRETVTPPARLRPKTLDVEPLDLAATLEGQGK